MKIGDRILDEKDKKILNEIQSRFPISQLPFEELGKRLQMEPWEVFQRVRELKEKGIIRRIGASLSSSRLSFSSTLCAARVPASRIEEFVEVVNGFSGVTHNYLRDHEYNVWFTFIARDRKTIESAIEEIKQRTGIEDIIDLPAQRTFKIKVDFGID